MKKLLSILLAVFMVFALVGCSSSSNEATGDDTPDAKENGYQIAVVTDVGQLNDGGFNQFTYQGAKAFAEKNGYTYNYYAPGNGENATDDDRIAAMRQAIENGAEVIVTPGFLQQPAIAAVAAESPEVKFVFVDGWNFGMANVTAICYAEEEAGYFVGYAAAKDGYTKLGGTFGGAAANPACNRYCFGYIQGINDAAKELGTTCDVTVSFLNGASFSASPELATQISGWYNNGTQVVFSCGGSMLQSVKQAAEEYPDAKIIGVDVDQHLESEKVITSACKGLAASVEKTLDAWLAGNWDAELADKTNNMKAADQGTEIPTNAEAWRFNTFTVDEYKTIFDKVVAGEIKISSDCADLTDAANNPLWAALKTACTNVNLTVEE